MKMEKQETAKTIAGHDVKRVHEKISDYLVRSEYDYICVINTQTGMLYVDTDELHADWDWTGEEHDYYDARALLVETFLDDYALLGDPIHRKAVGRTKSLQFYVPF